MIYESFLETFLKLYNNGNKVKCGNINREITEGGRLIYDVYAAEIRLKHGVITVGKTYNFSINGVNIDFKRDGTNIPTGYSTTIKCPDPVEFIDLDYGDGYHEGFEVEDGKANRVEYDHSGMGPDLSDKINNIVREFNPKGLKLFFEEVDSIMEGTRYSNGEHKEEAIDESRKRNAEEYRKRVELFGL